MKRRRGDAVKRAWFAAGRPGPLAAFRLEYASSRRPPPRRRKASRGMAGAFAATGGRKAYGSGAFTRVAPGGSAYEGPPRWDRFASERRQAAAVERMRVVPRGQIEALNVENQRAYLHTMDLPDAAHDALDEIDPARWYAVEVVAVGGDSDGPAGDGEAPPGYEPSRRRYRFVGIGSKLWYKLSSVMGGALVEAVNVHDVSGALSPAELRAALSYDPTRQAWALWGTPKAKAGSVGLARGGRFQGRGDYDAWKARAASRKGGRPRRRTGRLTYEEGKRAADADRKAGAREAAHAARVEALRTQGKGRQADALERRRRAGKRGAAKKKPQPSIFKRAKPRKKKGRKR